MIDKLFKLFGKVEGESNTSFAIHMVLCIAIGIFIGLIIRSL